MILVIVRRATQETGSRSISPGERATKTGDEDRTHRPIVRSLFRTGAKKSAKATPCNPNCYFFFFGFGKIGTVSTTVAPHLGQVILLRMSKAA